MVSGEPNAVSPPTIYPPNVNTQPPAEPPHRGVHPHSPQKNDYIDKAVVVWTYPTDNRREASQPEGGYAGYSYAANGAVGIGVNREARSFPAGTSGHMVPEIRRIKIAPDSTKK